MTDATRSAWSDADREAGYTRLCEAVTAAGPAQESLFLARLALLLAEELSDLDALTRALAAAAVPDGAA